MGLEDLLDNLLLFDQESTNNTVSDTVGTTRTTISTADVLLGLRDSSELTRTESLDLYERKNNQFHVSSCHLAFPSPPFSFLSSSNTYTSESFTTITTTRSLNRLLFVLDDELST